MTSLCLTRRLSIIKIKVHGWVWRPGVNHQAWHSNRIQSVQKETRRERAKCSHVLPLHVPELHIPVTASSTRLTVFVLANSQLRPNYFGTFVRLLGTCKSLLDENQQTPDMITWSSVFLENQTEQTRKAKLKVSNLIGVNVWSRFLIGTIISFNTEVMNIRCMPAQKHLLYWLTALM